MTISDLTEQPESEGFDDFFSNLMGEEAKKEPVESVAVPLEQPEVEATEAPEEAAETPSETSDDPDDVEVEFKAGETDHKAKLRDLKAAFAAQTEVTARATALAVQAQTVAQTDARASAALKAMMDRATERFKPYADLDMLVLSQRMDTESFAALRADAAAAEADVKFLGSELEGHMKATQERAQGAYKEAAAKCIATLSDPKTGIAGWGQPLYTEMLTFADANGLPAARQFTDPAALRVLHMAMQFAKAQAATKVAATKVTKVVNTPSRTLKPGAAAAPTNSAKDAMASLRKSGSVDDAERAFMASFKE